MSKKAVIIIVALTTLLIATIAIIYATQLAPPKVEVGVKVGDTFTYQLQGTSILIGPDATEPKGFTSYNDTEHYTVTIKAINDTTVTMDTTWEFKNGTQTNEEQTTNIANGETNGFWAIYPTNLNVGNLIRPTGYDEVTVNATDTKTYANETRQRNYFSQQGEFYDINDPTYSTWRFEHTSVYFDKQTGMLETLTNIQEYNNPQYRLIITWRLIDTSVWDV